MTRRMRALLASLVVLSTSAVAAPSADSPPPALISGDAARGAALDPVFQLLALQRMSCKFTEEKTIALLARPLKSSGTILFERDRGIVRSTVTPKATHVVLTKTALQIRTAKTTETIPLDKSKDLKAFAMIFPSLLRGDRAELEKSFDIGLYGSAKGTAWWALAFTPRTDSLKKLVKRVVVIGKSTEMVSLQILETSGDTTDTRLTDLRKNADVSDSEIATAFGAP